MRGVIEEDDLRARYNHIRDGLDDIARRRIDIFKRRPKPWISISESDMDDIYADFDAEAVMGLKRFVNSPNGVIRREAEAILQSQEWQELNRIERNIRPMHDDLSNRLYRRGIENHNNQQMARGEVKPMNGGSTIPERGLAAEIRELHPLVNSGDRGTDSRVGQFNLLLNQVVHDKTTAPFDREGMKLIRAVARNDRFEDLGRAPAVPPEALASNEENNRRVQALIPVIKSPQKAPRAPGAVSAPVAPGEAEGSVSDENQAPRLPLHMMRGEMWEEGRNRRYF
jgi:hypothetical protein